MALDCVAVSQQVSTLRAHLRKLQNERENCTDNCDEIEQKIKQTTQQIVAAQNQLAACESLQSFFGVWAFNGNGFTGPILINSGQVSDDGTISLTGLASIDGNMPPLVDVIDGIFVDRRLSFARFSSVDSNGNPRIPTQIYTGYLFETPRGSTPLTFAGTFFAEDQRDVLFGWFMTKQF